MNDDLQQRVAVMEAKFETEMHGLKGELRSFKDDVNKKMDCFGRRQEEIVEGVNKQRGAMGALLWVLSGAWALVILFKEKILSVLGAS